ncbi:MAG: polysaccharide pyruvyl transferase family protein, partial [Elusimicrobiota bacterium]
GMENIIEKKWDRPEELADILSKLDLLIGMRLHSLILGALVNIPMLGVGYDPKVREFCNLAGIEYLDLDEFSADRIGPEINRIAGIPADYSNSIRFMKERLDSSWLSLSDFINRQVKR